MTRVTTRNVVLFAVILALCTSVVAPASAMIEDGDSGTALDSGLEDDETTSDELPGSSDGSESDDSTEEQSTETSDDSETDDSNEERSTETGDDSETDDSAEEPSTNESAPADSNGSDDREMRRSDDVPNRTVSGTPVEPTSNVSAGILEALEYELLLALSLGGDTDRVESSPVGGDETTAPNAPTDDADETVTVKGSLEARVAALLDGTGVLVTDLTGTITGEEGTPTRFDGDRHTDSASGASTAGTGGGSGPNAPPPSDSTTGVAVGVGALAVAGVARNGALFPSGLAKLGSLVAGFAPVVGRSSPLDRLVRTLAPFRYSRYDDSDPLEHDARAEVYEVVNGAPGAYLSKVADRADLPLSTARHHIRVLEREELVSGAKVRGKRRFYPAYTSGIELAAALDDEATAAVIDAVARFGSASVSDIAAELDRDPSTVSHHLSRLAEDGIVVRERDGRAVINRLSPEARTALEPGRETETEAAEAAEALASD